MGKKNKSQPPRKGGYPAVAAPRALPADTAPVEPDDEDVAFIQSHRRQLGFLSSAALEDAPAGKRRAKRVEKPEEPEEAYERAPRVAADWEADAAAAVEIDALPSKTADGRWVYKAEKQPEDGAAAAPGKPRARAAPAAAAADAPGVRPDARDAPRGHASAALEQLQDQEVSLTQKKERIAAACTALLEAPERNISELKVLHRLAMDANVVVARLASLSAMLVYRDLAPGYRIRPPTDKELEMTVSKEVRAMRDYESAFLKAYQSFLQLLLAAAGGPDGTAAAPAKKGAPPLALDQRTALRCMCGLLQALPQFNYRSDLLRALIPRLASEEAAVAQMVTSAVATVLESDSLGEATLETVQLIADLVKRRDCSAPPHTLDALKSVRFDANLVTHLKDEREKAKPVTQKQRNRKWIEERRRLRDEAKSAARQNVGDAARGGGDDNEDGFDDRALRDFDALPDAAARLQLQTSTLEAVCEIYFRVLKDSATPNHATGRPLLGVTFTGLARVAHLIDYEVVADILEVLRKLLADGNLVPELRARCLLAACDVLGGQGAALAVDTRDFHRHLYRLAEMPPSLATSATWSGACGVPLAGETGKRASTLWVRALSAMLLARMQRQVDTERVAAFSKRLSGVAFHAETGEAMSSLAVVCELLNRHPKLRRLLENEAGAARTYLPEVKEPESACALSSCLWELSLLQRHAHPSIAALATHVAAMPVEDASPPAPYGSMSPEEVSAAHTTALGGFRPAVPMPKPEGRRRFASNRVAAVPGGSALGGGDSDADAAVDEQQLRALFREAREYQENAALRAQAARLHAQLAQFSRHREQAARPVKTEKPGGKLDIKRARDEAPTSMGGSAKQRRA